MLKFIPNQPISFKERDSSIQCDDNDPVCLLARLNDRLCFQARQTSCLPQLLCNNDFASVGSDVIQGYGDFDDYTEAAQWDLDPAAWEFDEYSHSLCTTEDAVSGDAVFMFDSYLMSADCNYVLTFTISGHNDDTSFPPGDDLTITLPDGTVVVTSFNGTYQYVSLTGGSVTFTKGTAWFGCIDNVTLKCAGECWDISDLSSVALTGDGICKTDTEVADITVTHNVFSLQVGLYYNMEIRIDSMTQGSVEVFLGALSLGTFTENGIFGASGIATGTGFYFVMSGDFDGCVKYVNLYELRNDYTLKLKNSADDVTLIDLSTQLTYNRDLIEACVKFGSYELGQIQAAFVNNAVCMYLELESPADGDVATNGSLIVTNNSAIEDEWYFDNTLGYNAIQGKVELTGGSGYMYQDISNGGYVQGNIYYVHFDVLCLEGTPAFDAFTATIGADGSNAGGTNVWTASDYPQQVGHYVYKVTGGTDGDNFAFHFDDSFGLTKICIDNIRITETACPKELYRSNCIKYANSIEDVLGWDGSKLLTACNEEGESMGFDWSTGFKLQMRIFCDLMLPSYPTTKDEIYLQSNGRRKRVYAEKSKKLDLVIHETGEIEHDCISTMLVCDHFYIEDGYELEHEFIWTDNEYSPEWNQKSPRNIAEARTEVQRWDNTVFNTNCG